LPRRERAQHDGDGTEEHDGGVEAHAARGLEPAGEATRPEPEATTVTAHAVSAATTAVGTLRIAAAEPTTMRPAPTDRTTSRSAISRRAWRASTCAENTAATTNIISASAQRAVRSRSTVRRMASMVDTSSAGTARTK
jgi:hypothetical protein